MTNDRLQLTRLTVIPALDEFPPGPRTASGSHSSTEQKGNRDLYVMNSDGSSPEA